MAYSSSLTYRQTSSNPGTSSGGLREQYGNNLGSKTAQMIPNDPNQPNANSFRFNPVR
jgi:hypothetical protein